MAEIKGHASVETKITMQFTEQESRALDALVGYGTDAFIKVFYEHLGKAYMEKHELGLRSFFKSVRDYVPGVLTRADAAQAAFYEE